MTIHDDSHGDDPPPADPVRRDPLLSLETDEEKIRRGLGGEPRHRHRGRKIGWTVAFVLVVAAATVVAGAIAHAVWLTILFGLWQ